MSWPRSKSPIRQAFKQQAAAANTMDGKRRLDRRQFDDAMSVFNRALGWHCYLLSSHIGHNLLHAASSEPAHAATLSTIPIAYS